MAVTEGEECEKIIHNCNEERKHEIKKRGVLRFTAAYHEFAAGVVMANNSDQ